MKIRSKQSGLLQGLRLAFLAAPLAMGVACAKGAPSERACAQRGEWLVTGYYLPLESDFGPLDASARVGGHERRLNLDFMKAVKLQGWGRAGGGDYLGLAKLGKSVSGGASGGETW